MNDRMGRPGDPRRLPDAPPSSDATIDRDSMRSADRRAADVARRTLREQGIVAIEPDDQIAPVLVPGEAVITHRSAVELDRRQPCPDLSTGLGGDLYLTTNRLVHLGRLPLEFALDDISEAVVVGDTLLLVVGSGVGVTIRVDDPRLLRVEIAAARTARAVR